MLGLDLYRSNLIADYVSWSVNITLDVLPIAIVLRNSGAGEM